MSPTSRHVAIAARALSLPALFLVLAGCGSSSDHPAGVSTTSGTTGTGSGGSGGAGGSGSTGGGGTGGTVAPPPTWAITSDPFQIYEPFAGAVDASGVYLVATDVAPVQGRLEKRSLADGQLDPAFGTAGLVILPESGELAIDASDIFVASYADYKLMKRAKADGSAGWVASWGPMSANTRSIAVDATGVYVAGDYYGTAWTLEKYATDTGAPDAAFVSNDFVTQVAMTVPWRVLSMPSALYVAGEQWNGGTNAQWRVQRRDPANGALLWEKYADPHPYADSAHDVASDDAAVWVVGAEETSGPTEWRVEKRAAADGALVAGFGNGGVLGIDLGGTIMSPCCIAVDASSVYVGGYQQTSPTESAMRIERRDRDTGAPIASFGSGGSVVISVPGFAIARLKKLAVDESSLYVIGFVQDDAMSTRWHVELRDKTTGSL